ncbi:MAG: tRNA 5-methoxyuridine(34)/uridine 5-oxyacetic acid(34) synthase CmoB [Pseudomonadota bacterium]
MPEPKLPGDLAPVAPLVAARLAPDAHGDMPRWRDALAALPDLRGRHVALGDTVTVSGDAAAAAQARLREALLGLHPWRKGPFRLFDVEIDTEWRSDWKWQRIRPHLAPLDGARVLDVGAGNGYFGWRMLDAGARGVVGVDPMPVFCLQHVAVSRYITTAEGSTARLADANLVLPLRFEELPAAVFDAVFSLGVIYHRRDPQEHAARLFHHTRPGGQVVLESLVVEAPEPLRPDGRYARMRNVHVVPTPALMCSWLEDAGFADARVVDVARTTPAEQRSTDWMRFHSLTQALDESGTRTVEGHPPPTRAVVVARRPVYACQA